MWRRVVREPLLHFVVLGGLLFALDAATNSDDPAPDPAPGPDTGAPTTQPGPGASSVGTSRVGPDRDATIVVGPEVRAALTEQWTRTRGTPPTSEEIEREVSRWTEEELLYREGLERGLDQDDPRVRERVATKMGSVLRARVVLPEPTDDELRAWFQDHASKWAKAELYDFTQVYVEGHDAKATQRAAELLEQLREGAEPGGLGDTFQGGRRYRRRKIEDLAKSFQSTFVDGLETQALKTWALRRSRFGLHLVRLDARTPAEAPAFESVKADVRKDWEDARRTEETRAAFEELRNRWKIVDEP